MILIANRPDGLIRRNIPFIVALVTITGMLFLAVTADLLSARSTTAIDLTSRLKPPVGFGGTSHHLLGTDNLGRDVLSRLLYGIRTSLMIAFIGSVIGAIIGTSIGLIAARMRGLFDEAAMVLIDFQASMPFLIIALASLAFLGNSLVLFVAVLGLYGWEKYARLSRASALAILQQPFIIASRQFGGGEVHIYLRHVLPNIIAPLIVNMTIIVPEIIILESGLSFLGLGVQPPQSSLGNMLGAGREFLYNGWWLSFVPGIVIALTSLSVTIIGDELRDRLDPTSARGRQ